MRKLGTTFRGGPSFTLAHTLAFACNVLLPEVEVLSMLSNVAVGTNPFSATAADEYSLEGLLLKPLSVLAGMRIPDAESDPLLHASDLSWGCCWVADELVLPLAAFEVTAESTDAFLVWLFSSDVTDRADELALVSSCALFNALPSVSLPGPRLAFAGWRQSLPSKESFRRASIVSSPVQALSLQHNRTKLRLLCCMYTLLPGSCHFNDTATVQKRLTA